MIHVMRDGQQFGPYTIEDINAYLAQGTLLPTDQAWYEGAANWMPITDVPGVVHDAAPAPVVTGADPMAAANPEVAVAEADAAAAEPEETAAEGGDIQNQHPDSRRAGGEEHRFVKAPSVESNL